MKKLFLLICSILICAASYAQPIITTFSPTSDTIGSSVTITGTGFNTTANQNIVFFGATQAAVTAASATSLTVTVPLGATYQYISVTNLATNLTADSAQPFVVTFAGNILFVPKVDFSTGASSGPYSVSIGDIDGDGKTDLVVANNGNNTISVLRNTSTSGTVSFAAKVDLIATQPVSVSIGDIDGDGKLDLAVANYSGTVSVYLNTSTLGTVSFAAKVNFTIGAGTFPYSISIGDIDADGKPDLAVANSGNATVSVLRSTSTLGIVSFATKVDFTTGVVPYSVSIGDIDGDSKPDLAVANRNSSTVSVLHNTSTLGIVSFAAKVDFTTGSSPYSVSIGDIDGDGKADLAVANSSSGTVSVLHNTSILGTVSFAAKVDFTTNTLPYSVSIGDIDGDGKPDLAVANSNSNNVSVFRNTSTLGVISFAAKVNFTTGTNPYSVSIGDIDGDGNTDLITPNVNTNNVSVIRQVPTVVGIIEVSNNNNTLTIYPNPFSKQTTFVSSNVLNNATFVVYNSFGQQVKQLQNISGQTIVFHREDLASGVYFVRLMQDDEVIAVKKLVIAE